MLSETEYDLGDKSLVLYEERATEGLPGTGTNVFGVVKKKPLIDGVNRGVGAILRAERLSKDKFSRVLIQRSYLEKAMVELDGSTIRLEVLSEELLRLSSKDRTVQVYIAPIEEARSE